MTFVSFDTEKLNNISWFDIEFFDQGLNEKKLRAMNITLVRGTVSNS